MSAPPVSAWDECQRLSCVEVSKDDGSVVGVLLKDVVEIWFEACGAG
jgi:hypothetical protein